MGSIATALLALAAVIGLIVVMGRIAKRRTIGSLGSERGHGPLKVTQRVALGQKANIFVLDAGEKRLLIGVSGTQLALLGELEAETVSQEPVEVLDLSKIEDPERELLATWGRTNNDIWHGRQKESVVAGIRRLLSGRMG
ncbi:MAG: FliO/MopB family protein [Ferrimicrobium sp.]|jgi:flagellar biogenesis protein FliO|uniref:FliO/MopB family protein n=1 Tax=Ferrimicrobium acidiphilum TaxID=121039 RepID=A0ABV3Y0V0_9ACTN|nr:flagellar biosynthetic protein FliO [Ferrimicrobium sp.]MCL5973083.1 flagellar biosynthetic protein FliO [Actinomycetota bacterium]